MRVALSCFVSAPSISTFYTQRLIALSSSSSHAASLRRTIGSNPSPTEFPIGPIEVGERAFLPFFNMCFFLCFSFMSANQDAEHGSTTQCRLVHVDPDVFHRIRSCRRKYYSVVQSFGFYLWLLTETRQSQNLCRWFCSTHVSAEERAKRQRPDQVRTRKTKETRAKEICLGQRKERTPCTP